MFPSAMAKWLTDLMKHILGLGAQVKLEKSLNFKNNGTAEHKKPVRSISTAERGWYIACMKITLWCECYINMLINMYRMLLNNLTPYVC